MSTWYNLEVTVMGNRNSIAKLLNLDPDLDVYVDRIQLSFGQKNWAGIQFGKLIEQHPDLVFLHKMTIECDTIKWWLEKFDDKTKTIQKIFVENWSGDNREFNKKLLEQYTKEYPSLPEKHLNNIKGYEAFRWEMFLSDANKIREMLNDFESYSEMTSPMSKVDMEMEYAEPWEPENLDQWQPND